MLLLQIDRKEHFYAQQGLVFPHQDGLDALHSNIVLDGELVIDTDPETGIVSHCVFIGPIDANFDLASALPPGVRLSRRR